MILSVLIAGIVAVTVKFVVGCCCIPCVRGLLNRLITTAVGAPKAPGAIQAYMGIRYDLVNTDEMSPEGPDLIQLQYLEWSTPVVTTVSKRINIPGLLQ